MLSRSGAKNVYVSEAVQRAANPGTKRQYRGASGEMRGSFYSVRAKLID